jgi:hypothetical protein
LTASGHVVGDLVESDGAGAGEYLKMKQFL